MVPARRGRRRVWRGWAGSVRGVPGGPTPTTSQARSVVGSQAARADRCGPIWSAASSAQPKVTWAANDTRQRAWSTASVSVGQWRCRAYLGGLSVATRTEPANGPAGTRRSAPGDPPSQRRMHVPRSVPTGLGRPAWARRIGAMPAAPFGSRRSGAGLEVSRACFGIIALVTRPRWHACRGGRRRPAWAAEADGRRQLPRLVR